MNYYQSREIGEKERDVCEIFTIKSFVSQILRYLSPELVVKIPVSWGNH